MTHSLQTSRTLTMACKLHGHEGWVSCVAPCPGADRVVSGSLDGTIRLWSVKSNICEDTFTWSESIKVHSVVPSAVGRYIMSGCGDGYLRRWNIETRTCDLKAPGHVGPVYSVAASFDGKHFVSGGKDKTVRVWYIDELLFSSDCAQRSH